MIINGIQASNLRGLIEGLLNPLVLIFVLTAVFILLLLKPSRDRVSKRMGWMGLGLWVVLYMVSTPWLPRLMMSHLEEQYAQVKQVNPQVHWVVVLGGGAVKDLNISAAEALSGVSLKRVLEGLRLYKKLPDSRLVLSGRGTEEEVEYAVATRFDELTAWLGVPKAHRVLEVDSVNTADEARIVASLVGDAPFYLVTSASHMPRSMALFEKQGLHPVPAPCQYCVYPSNATLSARDFLPNAAHMVMFNTAWHEYLGLMWGLMRGKIGA
jgi:uncharacterized SAM-binding protein YcdF (DUF218 family)